MGTLKGQNFRILEVDETVGNVHYNVIGMATNCTVTLTNNTEEATTKDDVGIASKPSVVSKSWSVQVDSLDVANVASLLTAMKTFKKIHLVWDEVSTTDNQTALITTLNRWGFAYLTDATFNFNNRENSAKSLQFTGIGELGHEFDLPSLQAVTQSSYTKGQFVRLFLSSDNSAAPASVVAAARSLSLHTSLTLEDATTKDTTGDWLIQEPTGFSYDISTSALMRSGETITSSVGAKAIADIETIYENGTPVKFKIANVSGDNNRTASSTICSGSVVLTQLTMNGPNRQNADYTAQLNGYGELTVAA